MTTFGKLSRRDFNPLPPCGGRLFAPVFLRPPMVISIHSLRVEGDHQAAARKIAVAYFNPLPPCGGRRFDIENELFTWNISIHSLRVEGDLITLFLGLFTNYFNPLPPCGGRRYKATQTNTRCLFQSTPSVWRETAPTGDIWFYIQFQSTPSVWRETAFFVFLCQPHSISIHSLRVEGDPVYLYSNFSVTISIHSLRVEGDPELFPVIKHGFLFQSTPSVWRETPKKSVISVRVAFQSTPSVWRETWVSKQSFPSSTISIHSLRVEGDVFPVKL